MTRLLNRCLFLLGIGMLVSSSFVRAQQSTNQEKLEHKSVALIRDSLKHLIGQVETLHEDVLEDLVDRKEVNLYRQAEAVLVQLVKFEASLKPGLNRKRLYEDYDQVENKLKELLKAVKALGPKVKTLQRQAMRIEVAMEDVYFNVSLGDNSPDRTRKVVERQICALDDAAKDLNRTAKVALGGIAGRGEVSDAIKLMAEASGKCRKSVASGAKIDDLRADFAALSNAWRKVIDQMELLSPREDYYLLRSAGRIDVLYGRLHERLELKGKRPQLIIRS